MPVRNRMLLLASAWLLLLPVAARGQQTGNYADIIANDKSKRETILQSSEWRRLRRSFDQWLSIQKIYSDQQVVELKTRLERRIQAMTAIELEDFMVDTEERLEVLMSDEAMEARDWLSVFTLEGRQRRLGRDEDAPDTFDMTVAQLRRELRQFQQQRASRAAAQGAFNQAQQQRVTDAVQQKRSQQREQQDARAQAKQRASEAALQQQRDSAFQGPYAPRTVPPRRDRERAMYVTPWGGVGFLYGF